MSSDLESNLHQINIDTGNPSQINVYEFEEFRLDVDHLMLFRNGEEVQLPPKQVETLLALIERTGEVVSKNELMTRLWGDMAVEEANLIQNIYVLRKTIGEPPDSKPYIETLRRRGYRFNAKGLRKRSNGHVSPGTNANDAVPADLSVDSPHPIDSRKQDRRFNWRFASVSALGLGILGFALWMLGFSNPAGPEGAEKANSLISMNLRTKRLSTDGGIYHAVLSPNGKHVYYIRLLGEKQSIRVRHLETDAESELIGGIDAVYGGLDISPDGQSLYFTRKFNVSNELDLFRVPSSGGIPVRIAEGLSGSTSISPDGSLITYVRCPERGQSGCSLFVSDSDTGDNERLLISTPNPLRINDSVFLADGRSVIYAVGQSLNAANEFRLRKVSTDTGQDEAYSKESFFIIKYLARVRGSNTILFTASRKSSDGTQLWIVNESNRETSLIEKLEGYPNTISIDQSASRMTATVVVPDFRLETYDLSKGSNRKFLGSAESAVFSPDGRVVFSSPMSGQMDLWISEPDGNGLRQLTSDLADERGIALSQDGTHIFFSSNRSGELQVWMMNKDGTNPRQLTREVGGYPLAVSSNDGSVFYKSHIDDVLRRVAADGSVEDILMSNFTWYPVALSPAARLIAYLEKIDSKDNISIADLGGTKIRSLSLGNGVGRIEGLHWSFDARSIYFLVRGPNEGRGTIHQIPSEGGAHVEITDVNLGPVVPGQGFAVSNDGQRFAIASGKWKHDLILIDFYN